MLQQSRSWHRRLQGRLSGKLAVTYGLFWCPLIFFAAYAEAALKREMYHQGVLAHLALRTFQSNTHEYLKSWTDCLMLCYSQPSQSCWHWHWIDDPKQCILLSKRHEDKWGLQRIRNNMSGSKNIYDLMEREWNGAVHC